MADLLGFHRLAQPLVQGPLSGVGQVVDQLVRFTLAGLPHNRDQTLFPEGFQFPVDLALGCRPIGFDRAVKPLLQGIAGGGLNVQKTLLYLPSGFLIKFSPQKVLRVQQMTGLLERVPYWPLNMTIGLQMQPTTSRVSGI